MVPLGFQLGDDDDRQDYLVLIKARDSRRVGEQDTGVEYVRTATLGIDHADSPRRRDGPGAKTGHRRVGWTGRGPQKGRAGPSVSSPARNARSTKIRGPSRERRRAVHHYRRYPGSCYSKSTTRGGTPPAIPIRASRTREPGPLRAETPTPRGVGAERAEEVDLAERGPVGVAEVELGVGALPEQETAEALLARGPDDQVGVGLAGRVEVLGDVLDVEHFG